MLIGAFPEGRHAHEAALLLERGGFLVQPPNIFDHMTKMYHGARQTPNLSHTDMVPGGMSTWLTQYDLSQY